MEWRRVFGAKGVKGVIQKGETVRLFCGDLDPTLCDPGGRKGLCPSLTQGKDSSCSSNEAQLLG